MTNYGSEHDGNSQKRPLGQSLQRLAAAKAADETTLQGKSLPCKVTKVHGPWLVDVNLAVDATPWTIPVLTNIPVLAPPYIAYPIQVGDAGLLIPANVRIAAISGQGGTTPKITDVPANLTALSFVWMGQAAGTTIDPNALVLLGNVVVSSDHLSFFAASKVVQQAVTGALSLVSDTNAKNVLTSILHALAANGYNLLKDNTT